MFWAINASEDVQNPLREKKAPIAAAVDSLKRLKEQLASVETFVNGLKAYTDGVAQAGNGASQLYDGANTLSGGMTELSDGLAELKAKLTEEGLDLLSGDVQKALDLFDNLESQMANVPSFDLVADGMAYEHAADYPHGLAEISAKKRNPFPLLKSEDSGSLFVCGLAFRGFFLGFRVLANCVGVLHQLTERIEDERANPRDQHTDDDGSQCSLTRRLRCLLSHTSRSAGASWTRCQ